MSSYLVQMLHILNQNNKLPCLGASLSFYHHQSCFSSYLFFIFIRAGLRPIALRGCSLRGFSFYFVGVYVQRSWMYPAGLIIL